MRIIFIILFFSVSLFAKLQVSVTYPYIAEITKAVGGENVEVNLLSKGSWDPHFVVPKPSLIATLRESELLIINGASLEIGWLPPLLNSANNPTICDGGEGFLDLSRFVTMINVPTSVDRAKGDVHAQGNPHFNTDPHNILPLAKVIMLKLTLLDKENEAMYRQAYQKFAQNWQTKLKMWDERMHTCEGKKIIQYHELYNYFLTRYKITNVANIEPFPGIMPSSKRAVEVVNKVKDEHVTLILQDVYHNQKTAAFIAEKTGINVVLMPHDVGALDQVDSLETLYDTMIERICP